MHMLYLQSHGGRTVEYSIGMWHIGLGTPLTPVSWSDLGIDVRYTPSVVKSWRLELSKTLYYSTEYTRASLMNKFTMVYQDDSGAEKYGVIKFFLELLSNFFLKVPHHCSHWRAHHHCLRGSECDSSTIASCCITAAVIHWCINHQIQVYST